jgi:transposase
MRWSHARDRHGDAGLEVRFSPGRPIRLKQNDRKHLLRMLKLGALKHGFDTDHWSGPRIADLIKREFHVDYHRNNITRLLHTMGWEFRPPGVWCPVEAP